MHRSRKWQEKETKETRNTTDMEQALQTRSCVLRIFLETHKQKGSS